MDKAAYEALSLVLSSDPNVRLAAETRLKELEKLPGWFKIRYLFVSERVSSQESRYWRISQFIKYF